MTDTLLEREPHLLTPEQTETFHRDGVLVLRSFYDLERDIEPIQYAIYRIIGLVIEKYGLPIRQVPFRRDSFDSGYQELIAHDRTLGGEVYDAVKQIPAFLRLVCVERHDRIFRLLREGAMPGVAAAGYGIRIDNPNEEKYRADWHQDYPGQFRSLDGLVFWSPLLRVEEAMGPVQFCLGSHKDGLLSIRTTDPDHPEKTGAYGLILDQREERVARYPQIAPLTEPGDLVVIDYLTLHASGYNRGLRSRWTMQMRYFNFLDPTGIKIGWRGSFAAGVRIEDIHPEMIAG